DDLFLRQFYLSAIVQSGETSMPHRFYVVYCSLFLQKQFQKRVPASPFLQARISPAHFCLRTGLLPLFLCQSIPNRLWQPSPNDLHLSPQRYNRCNIRFFCRFLFVHKSRLHLWYKDLFSISTSRLFSGLHGTLNCDVSASALLHLFLSHYSGFHP